jgi:DNA polymerase III subunit chi
VERMKRVMILFDGQNEAILNQARMQWKEVATLGQEAQFWSEASGSWALQQSRPAD